MELEEYKRRKKELETACHNEVVKLGHEYALSCAICEVGDIVQEIDRILIVEKISSYPTMGEAPEPVYTGTWLKKDLAPRKSGEIISIYGNRLTTVIKRKSE